MQYPWIPYIISRGSSGTWKPIFPSKEIADGNNHVEGFRPYKMPPKSRMVFDEQTGAEKLFIVFSREPEPEFENMIYSLPGSKATPEPTKPASTPESPVKKPKDMVMMAQVNIKDTNVNQVLLIVNRFEELSRRTVVVQRAELGANGAKYESILELGGAEHVRVSTLTNQASCRGEPRSDGCTTMKGFGETLW